MVAESSGCGRAELLHPSSPFDPERASPADSPSYPRCGRVGCQAPFVNAVKVAPDAERREIFVFIAASSRPKVQMVGRHVAARAHGARASKLVAPIDVEVFGFRARVGEPFMPKRGEPGVTEVFAQETEETR